MTKLIFLAGSNRKKSFNKRLAHTAMKLAEDKDASVEFIDLNDYPMPIINEDLMEEEGIPQSVKDLKEKFKSADGFFIACPEYNGSITPLLKNTIDWLTQKTDENDQTMAAFKGKVGAVSSASPGALGGIRSLAAVRPILDNCGTHLIPAQVAVGGANDAFNEIGLIDDTKMKMLDNVITQLVETTKKLNA